MLRVNKDTTIDEVLVVYPQDVQLESGTDWYVAMARFVDEGYFDVIDLLEWDNGVLTINHQFPTTEKGAIKTRELRQKGWLEKLREGLTPAP